MLFIANEKHLSFFTAESSGFLLAELEEYLFLTRPAEQFRGKQQHDIIHKASSKDPC